VGREADAVENGQGEARWSHLLKGDVEAVLLLHAFHSLNTEDMAFLPVNPPRWREACVKVPNKQGDEFIRYLLSPKSDVKSDFALVMA